MDSSSPTHAPAHPSGGSPPHDRTSSQHGSQQHELRRSYASGDAARPPAYTAFPEDAHLPATNTTAPAPNDIEDVEKVDSHSTAAKQPRGKSEALIIHAIHGAIIAQATACIFFYKLASPEERHPGFVYSFLYNYFTAGITIMVTMASFEYCRDYAQQRGLGAWFQHLSFVFTIPISALIAASFGLDCVPWSE